MHRFHFSSVLKRMSTIVETEAEGAAGSSWWVLSKGAPEVVQGMLASVPSHYEKVYKVSEAQTCARLSPLAVLLIVFFWIQPACVLPASTVGSRPVNVNVLLAFSLAPAHLCPTLPACSAMPRRAPACWRWPTSSCRTA